MSSKDEYQDIKHDIEFTMLLEKHDQAWEEYRFWRDCKDKLKDLIVQRMEGKRKCTIGKYKLEQKPSTKIKILDHEALVQVVINGAFQGHGEDDNIIKLKADLPVKVAQNMEAENPAFFNHYIASCIEFTDGKPALKITEVN